MQISQVALPGGQGVKQTGRERVPCTQAWRRLPHNTASNLDHVTVALNSTSTRHFTTMLPEKSKTEVK